MLQRLHRFWRRLRARFDRDYARRNYILVWRAWWLPWWLMCLIDRHFNTCWVSFVMLKMNGYREWREGWGSLWVSGQCWSGPPGEEWDYCGKYRSAGEAETARRTWRTWSRVRERKS